MKIALISAHYPPQKTSCAVQMRDLARELVKMGHNPIVIVPVEKTNQSIYIEKIENIQILRIPTFKISNVGNIRRAFNEILMSFNMISGLKKNFSLIKSLDAVVWYSPTIFFGPLIKYIKNSTNCKSYLILRDMFPEWALDLGILKKNLIYYFLKIVANYQYSLADTIGVQTFSNLKYFNDLPKENKSKIEVLNNWLSPSINKKCRISINDTKLKDKKIFVYIGNMGVAQGIKILVELANSLKNRKNIGFIFVGRGSELNKLKNYVEKKDLDNVLFFDEIDPDEISDLLKMCHVGLIALDLHHKSHNIPGKLLAYLQSGLPVLARVNKGTDLQKIIEKENLGVVSNSSKANEIKILLENLIANDANLKSISERCRIISSKMFSSKSAAEQIVSSLSGHSNNQFKNK